MAIKITDMHAAGHKISEMRQWEVAREVQFFLVTRFGLNANVRVV